MTLKEIRTDLYNYCDRVTPDVNDWKHSPYSCLKARLYVEAGSILVYFLLKTNITANAVSVVHALIGIIGGALLAVPSKPALVAAVFIFFLKPILDWGDGTLARLKGQASLTGAVLDVYATLLGFLFFQIGFGFYLAHKSGMSMFYYLAALMPLFSTRSPQLYGFYMLYLKSLTPDNIKEYMSKKAAASGLRHGSLNTAGAADSKLKRTAAFFIDFFDGSARIVDFILLLILIEMFSAVFVSWIIFFILLIRQFLVFIHSFSTVAGGAWAEEKHAEKMMEISKAFE